MACAATSRSAWRATAPTCAATCPTAPSGIPASCAASPRARQTSPCSVAWLVRPAEAVIATLGPFQLVTIGQAFHWMDRDEVLRRVGPTLVPDGGIALVGGTTIWGAPEPWAQAVEMVVRRWLGEERRA